MNIRRLPIFLMHVPKTAGTSVFLHLRSSFLEHEICPNAHSTRRWRAHEVPGYQLYWGHFSADFVKEMGCAGTKLIMMRNPLHRVLSLYDYWRSHRWEYINSALPPHPYNGPHIAKSGDLADFLSTKLEFALENIYNPVARQLLGRRFKTLWPDEDAVIAESLRALQDFEWIGITELFEQSIALLNRILDLPIPEPMPKANATYARSHDDPVFDPADKTEPTTDECTRIMEGNRIDFEIYREGCKLLGRRIWSRPDWHLLRYSQARAK